MEKAITQIDVYKRQAVNIHGVKRNPLMEITMLKKMENAYAVCTALSKFLESFAPKYLSLIHI